MLRRRRDPEFPLFDMPEMDRLVCRERYAMHDRVTFDAVLDVAFRLADEHLAPHTAGADSAEPRLEDGRVIQIPGTAAALECLREAGLFTGS